MGHTSRTHQLKWNAVLSGLSLLADENAEEWGLWGCVCVVEGFQEECGTTASLPLCGGLPSQPPPWDAVTRHGPAKRGHLALKSDPR